MRTTIVFSVLSITFTGYFILSVVLPILNTVRAAVSAALGA